MLFPISDDDRHLLRPAYVTISLVVANVLVFFYQVSNPAFTYAASVVAGLVARFSMKSEPPTPFRHLYEQRIHTRR
jgi:hypothetical protein